MKQWHLIHIVLLISLFVVNIYGLGSWEQSNRMEQLLPHYQAETIVRLLSFVAMFVLFFSMIIGMKLYSQQKKLGRIWTFLAIVGCCCMVLIVLNMIHIDCLQLLLFCMAYMCLGTIGSVLQFLDKSEQKDKKEDAFF